MSAAGSTNAATSRRVYRRQQINAVINRSKSELKIVSNDFLAGRLSRLEVTKEQRSILDYAASRLLYIEQHYPEESS